MIDPITIYAPVTKKLYMDLTDDWEYTAQLPKGVIVFRTPIELTYNTVKVTIQEIVND